MAFPYPVLVKKLHEVMPKTVKVKCSKVFENPSEVNLRICSVQMSHCVQFILGGVSKFVCLSLSIPRLLLSPIAHLLIKQHNVYDGRCYVRSSFSSHRRFHEMFYPLYSIASDNPCINSLQNCKSPYVFFLRIEYVGVISL
jgi:hypothetical protein